MSTGNRTFDPQAALEFKYFIESLLEFTENELVKTLKREPLRRAPALGFYSSGLQRAQEYEESWKAIWRDLQYMRGMYKAIINNIEIALEGHETSEEINVKDQDEFVAALEGVAAPKPTVSGETWNA